jgi:DNA repair exonuclease SbcCD ATPase subunit
MKQIVVTEISASGFMSIAEPVTLSLQPGFYLITGENLDDSEVDERSNGSGKTTLPSALEFAFYGTVNKGSKAVKKSDIPYWGKPKSHCAVVAKFEVREPDGTTAYKISRSINPNKLVLYKEGVKNPISKSESAATQAMIERIIGIPPHIYDQCMSLRDKSRASKFLEYSKAEREKFVNVVFDLSKFKNMEKQVRADYNEGVKELDKIEAVQREVDNRLVLVKTQLATALQEQAAKKWELEKRIEEEEENLQNAEKAVEDKKKSLQDSCKDAEEKLDNAKKNEEKAKKALLEEIENSKKQVASLEEELQEAQVGDVSELERKKEEIEDLYSEVRGNIKDFQRRIRQHNERIKEVDQESVCSYCNRPFDDCEDKSKQKEKLAEEIKEFKKKLAKFTESAERTQTALNSIRERLSNYNSKQRDRNKAELRVQTIQKEINSLETKLSNWSYSDVIISQNVLDAAIKRRDSFDGTEIVDSLRRRVEDLNKQLKDLMEDPTIQRFRGAVEETEIRLKEVDTERRQKVDDNEVLSILKTASGETGVRKLVLDKLIELFNKRLAFFLKSFELPFTVVFDGSFNADIKNKNGKDYGYPSMSGGEQKRLDLAISFTFKEILRAQNQIRFNFCVYDEIFDTSLDEVGQRKILQYLRDEVVTNGEAVYVVTNNRNFAIEDSTRIHMTKKDGKTTMEIL